MSRHLYHLAYEPLTCKRLAGKRSGAYHCLVYLQPVVGALIDLDPGLPFRGRLECDAGHDEVRSGREGALVSQIEQALEAPVLLTLFPKLDDLPLKHLDLFGESLRVLVGRPERGDPVVAVLEGLGDAGTPGLHRGQKPGSALPNGMNGARFGLPKRHREHSERRDDQGDEDEPSPRHLVARHMVPR